MGRMAALRHAEKRRKRNMARMAALRQHRTNKLMDAVGRVIDSIHTGNGGESAVAYMAQRGRKYKDVQ